MFIKHFVRFNTREALPDGDVIDFFDVVQSIVPTKLLVGISKETEDKVSVDVLLYQDSDKHGELFIHEIILDVDIDANEGDEIAQVLLDEFPDHQFTFEASIEV